MLLLGFNLRKTRRFSAGDVKVHILYDRRAVLLDFKGDYVNRYLVVSDIHVGFEQRFRSSGVRIHSDIEAMISELESVIGSNHVTDLIINGDLKSGVDRILESEWENVPKFLMRLSRLCRIHVIPGNHDAGLGHLIPANVMLEGPNGIFLDDTLILHGHTRPLEKFSQCKRLIIGHAHPILKRKGSPLSGQPVWAFLKIRKKQIFKDMLESDSMLEVIVMPSFNLELSTSGYQSEPDDERKASSLMNDLRNSDEAAILTLGGEMIGDASMLTSVL